jgi:hypothetical protein
MVLQLSVLQQYCPPPLGTKAMDNPPQKPPPPPLLNAGDPAGLLVIGKFVIEGIDGVTPKTRKQVDVFYNQLITMMEAAGPLWQLMWKE